MREPRTYLAILSSVAEGKVTQGEVASAAHADPRIIGKYVDLLEGLDILARVKPLGYGKPVRLKFKDNYFRFWFTYIYRLRNLLEAGYVDEAVRYILESFNGYLSRVFEDVILELAPKLYGERLLPVKPVEAGGWWHKDAEIDAVVREPGKATAFIEAKWSKITLKDAEREISRLEEKASKTGLTSPENNYILVVRELMNAETPCIIDKHKIAVDLKAISKILHIAP